jgi:hypothetical protein
VTWHVLGFQYWRVRIMTAFNTEGRIRELGMKVQGTKGYGYGISSQGSWEDQPRESMYMDHGITSLGERK